ncbi:ABC transporter permease [Rahnella victoriana]|uniref:ABC transporter permease n=2 Tax=Rahnella victoriana TaxID=1510570 RepID=A0ABS0DUA1_9GAMM|nr:ABC transporter permease [Rahnella victoriana]
MSMTEKIATKRMGQFHLGGLPRQQALRVGIIMLSVWVLIALLSPWIAPFDPVAQDASVTLSPPTFAHPFGTDNFGRDILSRVMWGARIDLQICLIGVIFPFTFGTLIGAFSGYLGGAVDTFLMRVIDVVLAFPFLVLMLSIIAILGPGLGSFYIAMAMVGWVSYARLVRSQVLTLKHRDFILAARSLGYSHPRILLLHLLPNALTSSLVFSMSDCVLVLLSGASVSYLGLGVQPPVAEWGVMVADGQSFITTAWWITTFPGLAIVVLAMSFSLLADGLGDKLGERP